MNDILINFHWLRPKWLFFIIPCITLLCALFAFKKSKNTWKKVISPKLMPYLSVHKGEYQHANLFTLAIGWIICCLILAGPSWQEIKLPTAKSKNSLVLVVNMSEQQMANDMKPSRLDRLKYKLYDLLTRRNSGQTALIVYAGDSYVVAPLTEDNQTLSNLVSALNPSIMPFQGGNALSGVKQAIQLLQQESVKNQEILLITPDIPNEQLVQIEDVVKASGQYLSILGIGSTQGAPIIGLNGYYIKDKQDNIVISKLDSVKLEKLAQNLGGNYQTLTLDDQDLNEILSKPKITDDLVHTDRTFNQWKDDGYWFLLILFPIVLLSFRKGWLITVIILINLPHESLFAMEWQSLWKNDNQRAEDAFKKNNYAEASKLFHHLEWEAESLYRDGKFQEAVKKFSEIKTDKGFYHQGNALARLGSYDKAIDMYNKALKINPNMQDAKFNKEILEKLKKQQEKDQNNTQPKEDQKNSSNYGSDAQQHKEQNSNQNNTQSKEDQKNSSRHGSDTQQNKEQNSNQNDIQSKEDQKNNSSHSSDAQQNQEQNSNQNNIQSKEDQKDGLNRGSDAQQAQKNSSQDVIVKEDKKNTERSSKKLDNQKKSKNDGYESKLEGNSVPKTSEEQAVENWLNSIKDDPGGLLRRKFEYEQQMRYDRVRQGR